MTIYGKQVSIHALTKHENKIEKIYLTKLSILPKELLKKYGSKIKIIENRWAQKMAKGGNHQGIIVELEDILEPTLDNIKRCEFILMLDGLTDIGNIGAIIRSAYALGVEAVVVTGIRDLKRDAVARTSSGASLDLVPIVVHNPLDLLNELKQLNFKIYGADLDGKPLKEATFEQKRVLVLGSEDRGISKRVKAKIDSIYKIEMAREFDSLNVSAAAAIFIYRMSNAVK